MSRTCLNGRPPPRRGWWLGLAEWRRPGDGDVQVLNGRTQASSDAAAGWAEGDKPTGRPRAEHQPGWGC
eukprot:2267335-Alexandrium_andersonii.AAC.1